MKTLRKDDLKKLIFVHLNINSVRNRVDPLDNVNVDILIITEFKLDKSFPNGQVSLDGFGTPFRLDRERNGGVFMLFIRNDIPSKVVSTQITNLLKVFM